MDFPPPGLSADPDALRLLALAAAIAEAIPRGEGAISEAIARSPDAALVADHRERLRRDGSVWGVIVTLAPAPPVTLDRLNRTLDAEAGRFLLPPGPELMSPSNVPPEAWGELPVYYVHRRPWGKLRCEHAHGDSAGRIRTVIVEPTPSSGGTSGRP
jgi:hypothetical protein